MDGMREQWMREQIRKGGERRMRRRTLMEEGENEDEDEDDGDGLLGFLMA